MAKYTVVIKPSQFSQSIEDVAYSLRAKVISNNKLKLDSKLVDESQLSYVLPIYGWELIEVEPSWTEKYCSEGGLDISIYASIGLVIVLSWFYAMSKLHQHNVDVCEVKAGELGINTSDPNFALDTMCDWTLYQRRINNEYNKRFGK